MTIHSSGLYPLTLRRDLSLFPLASDPTPSASISVDPNAVFADQLVCGPDDRILITTPSTIAYIQKGSELWRKPISHRLDTSVAPLPDNQVFFYTNKRMTILDEKTGAPGPTHETAIECTIRPLIRQDEIVVIVKEKGNNKICCFDFTLKQTWEYHLKEAYPRLQFFDFCGTTAVVSDNTVIILNGAGTEKSIPIFNPIQTTFKASSRELFIKDKTACYIFDIFTTEKKPIHIAETLKGTPIALPSDGAWNGFATPLMEENSGHGIYRYPLGLFDASGTCTRIELEHPIQYLTADSNNVIISLSGPSLEVFNQYKNYTNTLKYEVRLLSATGKELDKISLQDPVVGPVAVTQSGEITGFASGALRFYRTKLQSTPDPTSEKTVSSLHRITADLGDRDINVCLGSLAELDAIAAKANQEVFPPLIRAVEAAFQHNDPQLRPQLLKILATLAAKVNEKHTSRLSQCISMFVLEFLLSSELPPGEFSALHLRHELLLDDPIRSRRPEDLIEHFEMLTLSFEGSLHYSTTMDSVLGCNATYITTLLRFSIRSQQNSSIRSDSFLMLSLYLQGLPVADCLACINPLLMDSADVLLYALWMLIMRYKLRENRRAVTALSQDQILEKDLGGLTELLATLMEDTDTEKSSVAVICFGCLTQLFNKELFRQFLNFTIKHFEGETQHVVEISALKWHTITTTEEQFEELFIALTPFFGKKEVEKSAFVILSKAAPAANRQLFSTLLSLSLSSSQLDEQAAIKLFKIAATTATPADKTTILNKIEPYLAHHDPFVLSAALECLANIATAATPEEKSMILKMLEPCLAQRDSSILSAALGVITSMTTTATSEEKIVILKMLEPCLTHHNSSILSAALGVITSMTTTATSEEKIVILKMLKPCLTHHNSSVLSAAFALITSMTTTATSEEKIVILKMLEPYLGHSISAVNTAAMKLLNHVALDALPEEKTAILKMLEPNLAHEDYSVCTAALELFSKIATTGAVLTRIEPFLKHESYTIAAAAIKLLGKIAPNATQQERTTILEIIQPCLSHNNPTIRNQAKALQQTLSSTA